MSWIANFVRPKLRELVGGAKEVPDNLWTKCPSCGQMLFHRDLHKNLHVCSNCNHHMRLAPDERLKMLFDEGAYETIDLPKPAADPLKFRDLKKYPDRIKEARNKTGRDDAMVVGVGACGGVPTVMAALDFGFMGGSMGMAVGDAFIAASRAAVERHAPMVILTSSGGARMQEGIFSLMQMARTTVAIEELKDAGLPYIVILCDPTTGGVSASFAMLGDIQIAEPGAVIGFAGQRVIEQTIRETLPEGFQRAEYLLEHGMLDMVVERKELTSTLARVIGLLMRPNGSDSTMPVPIAEAEMLASDEETPSTVDVSETPTEAESKDGESGDTPKQ